MTLPYYKVRRLIEPENFYERNKVAIWFYVYAFIFVFLIFLPWVIGWIHIIF